MSPVPAPRLLMMLSGPAAVMTPYTPCFLVPGPADHHHCDDGGEKGGGGGTVPQSFKGRSDLVIL